MNDQPMPSQQGKNQEGELPPSSEPEKIQLSESTLQPTTFEERHLHHRSSSRRDRSQSKSAAASRGTHSQGRGSRGKSQNKIYLQARRERWILGGCIVLAIIVCLAIGFYFGQKSQSHTEVINQATQLYASFPTPEAESMLDTSFKALHEGNYREAMIGFQKAQDIQPVLFGIDYLIAESAYKAGENILADDAARHALSKSESSERASVLRSLITLAKTKTGGQDAQQLADPNVTAQTEIKQLVATHLGDAKAYALWGDLLRSSGEYRSAIDILHKGVLRADPEAARELLSAKEQLARLQNQSAKTVPSLSELTSMSGEQALVSALASLQLKQSEEAEAFLERARNLYSPQIFRELMHDGAFDDYHTDPKVKSFFKLGVH